MPNTINLASNLPGGSYNEWELSLTLTHDWIDPVEIYYTLDGTSPVTSATRILYNNATGIVLGGNIKRDPVYAIQAIALATDTGDFSDILSSVLLLNRPVTLNVSQPGGFYVDKTPITLDAYSANPAANISIYYTIDGSDVLLPSGAVSTNAILYTAPITQSDDFNLKAVAVDDSGAADLYSNFLDEAYEYEDENLELTITPEGGVFPDLTMAIAMSTNNPNATIRYTLDGKSPMCDAASIYSGPVTISTILDEEKFHLRAIAMTDRLISEPADMDFILYNPTADSDRDEIDNLTEGGPGTDTDSDGIADMHDIDSDNDGMPDFIEGSLDGDLNGIPAFQDSGERLPFWYQITGLPLEGDLINGMLYEITFLVYGQDGFFDIECLSNEVIFSETAFTVPDGESRTITMFIPEVMENQCSPLWSGEAFDVSITVTHLEAGEPVSELISRTYTIFPENSAVPYQGILVSWTKLEDASHYNIYRSDNDGEDYVILKTLPHDSFHDRIDTQQYLDREGTQASWYRVAAVVNGIEQALSNPLHSANGNLDTCEVIGHLHLINNTPMSSVRVTARVNSAPYLEGNTYVDAFEFHTFTDENGQFVLSLPKGSACLIKIDQAQLRKLVVIPYEDGIDFDKLLRLNQG